MEPQPPSELTFERFFSSPRIRYTYRQGNMRYPVFPPCQPGDPFPCDDCGGKGWKYNDLEGHNSTCPTCLGKKVKSVVPVEKRWGECTVPKEMFGEGLCKGIVCSDCIHHTTKEPRHYWEVESE